jgi:hexosaminidase
MVTRIIFLLLFVVNTTSSFSQVSVIPEPVSLRQKDGWYHFKEKVTIAVPASNTSLKQIGDQLKERLSMTGLPVTVVGANEKADISLKLNSNLNNTIGKEGYEMMVTPELGIQISANEPAGLFYGAQTLLQLLPAAIESKSPVKNVAWSIPSVEIVDYPRFGWRGLMFDVSRHFFGVKDVKEFIDDMASYKYNLLHMHLTDDQGWRIEIKSYPKLTSVGAWNVQKTGTFGTFSSPDPNEPRNFGGFFTQDDIKEIVRYAKERFINVMPEIDVPGHSLAAIAAYPELTCTPGTYQVNSGERFMVWPPSGHFYGLLDNTLCPANEKVYQFLDKVFTEVAQLFPFEYIHMGGDETARNFWEKSDVIKALMKR